MAQQYVTDAGTLVVPGAYPKINVQNNPSGLATTGVLMLVGEADGGPSYAEETDLSQNVFGPDQLAEFVAKYKAGNLVDAYRGAIAASNDPNITGSLNRVIPVKTNTPTKASSTLPKIGGGTYCNIPAKMGGEDGNLVSRTLTAATAEVVPTTGATLIAPPQQNTDVAFRVNGGAEVSDTLTTGMLPNTIATTISALAGVIASGGTNRNLLTGTGDNVTVVQDSGFQCHFTIDTTWDNVPTVGDLLYIPTGSPFAAANEGTYVVTAATTTRIDAYKLLDAAGDGDDRTAPSSEGPIAIAATTNIAAFAPIVVSVEAGAVVPGLGKSLEIANSGSEDFSNNAYVFASATSSPPAAAATWVSTSTVPYVLTSGAEYQVNLNVARQSDAISEDILVGGDVVLTLGYKGTSGSAVIANGVLTITVVGGAGASPAAITLSKYKTVSDLTTYLGSLTGFTAAPGTAAQGQLDPTTLDEGTYTIGTTHGAATGRIKADGKDFLDTVINQSVLVDAAAVAPATKLIGLPDVSSLAFLTGGARGATTAAAIVAALAALEAVRGNFVVTLFSRDATADITDGLTDASSTYTIAGVNAGLRAHVLQMSQMKRRRPRQGFASIRSTYAAAKLQAGNLASSRVALFFQDAKDVSSDGTLTQFQPWMAAIKAAGMQAAGFYRPIVNKFIAISGALQAAGDFNDQLDSHLENALLAGLCPIVRDEQGGYRWVSDQTTYTRDDNWVHNSIQATYVGDVIATTTAQRMERAFVGQSVADISAALALTTLEGIMSDMKRLKLIAASDDAPKGFKNAKIRITGPSMVVSLEIKLAGAIYFIPISFLVTPVQQSAG